MRRSRSLGRRLGLPLLCAAAIACSDDESGPGDGSGGTAGAGAKAGGGGSAGAGAKGGSAGSSGAVGSAGKNGAGGSSGSAGNGGSAGSSGGTSGQAGADGGGAGGANGTAGAGGSGQPDGGARCTLKDSGPITVTQNNQVIELVRIVSTSGSAINVNGHSGVVIRNVEIRHSGGTGIDISGSNDVRIENVSIEHTGAPASGANSSDARNNIACNGSMRPIVTNARLTRGSSGIYLVNCPDSKLSFLEGHDFRGPFPRGQLVQWDKSNNGSLEDFSVVNPPGSWPEDNVNIYQSSNVTVRRGLIDGNNSPSGVGVIFDGGPSTGLVEDVDAVHMGNGCFSDIAGGEGVIFRRTRCRDNICTSQDGRGTPLSNALMWCGHEQRTMLRIEQSTYFAACNPGNIVWPRGSFAVVDLVERDFTLRAPIKASLCWE